MSEAAAHAGPARRRRLPRPAPAMVIAAVAWGLLGAATSLGWLPAWGWTLAGGVLATLVLLDLALLLRTPLPDVARRVPEALALGVERAVRLELEPGHRGVRSLRRTRVVTDSFRGPAGPDRATGAHGGAPTRG